MATGILDLVFGGPEVSLSWRCALPTVVGLGAGLAFFHGAGQEPSSAVIAFGLTALGWCVGSLWHFGAGTRR